MVLKLRFNNAPLPDAIKLSQWRTDTYSIDIRSVLCSRFGSTFQPNYLKECPQGIVSQYDNANYGLEVKMMSVFHKTLLRAVNLNAFDKAAW